MSRGRGTIESSHQRHREQKRDGENNGKGKPIPGDRPNRRASRQSDQVEEREETQRSARGTRKVPLPQILQVPRGREETIPSDSTPMGPATWVRGTNASKVPRYQISHGKNEGPRLAPDPLKKSKLSFKIFLQRKSQVRTASQANATERLGGNDVGSTRTPPGTRREATPLR